MWFSRGDGKQIPSRLNRDAHIAGSRTTLCRDDSLKAMGGVAAVVKWRLERTKKQIPRFARDDIGGRITMDGFAAFICSQGRRDDGADGRW